MTEVYVSIGSNVDRERHVRDCLLDLRSAFGPIRCSSVYQTRAVGFEGDDFYNLVVAFDSDDEPLAIARRLKTIEVQHGRHKGEARFAPRTLDLDLLLHGNSILDTPELHLPRDEIDRYAFVLCPLAELAPDLRYPGRDATFAQMWARFPQDTNDLQRIEFEGLACHD
ncbi:MAG: 2-amino-4-hydroxy-6-hydroxymethyldihydropteridine diphosphokinase [Gammaproteobacteria bacterium]|nr:2-amino-4-hydroxy-6-hydroxymethyldihydropteridine diphosphokinase [Gammaproteobacteria bacterium]MCP5136424.1 2-amino-4-hydroxy-6-hydroxymethyldihydropteridine diphosphokinase [Gammaproteobacteria bacterium]